MLSRKKVKQEFIYLGMLALCLITSQKSLTNRNMKVNYSWKCKQTLQSSQQMQITKSFLQTDVWNSFLQKTYLSRKVYKLKLLKLVCLLFNSIFWRSGILMTKILIIYICIVLTIWKNQTSRRLKDCRCEHIPEASEVNGWCIQINTERAGTSLCFVADSS